MHETEVNNCLPFLDVLIMWSNDSFSTSVFHKPTFTGLYTNYNSFIPSVYKTGLISSLLNRYFSICSSYFIFDSHLQNLKKMLLLNGYPNSFIDTCIHRFLNKIFSPSPQFPSPPRKSFTFVFPTLVNIASKFALRFGSYAPVLSLTLTSTLFSILLSNSLTFLSLRKGFPGPWGLLLFTILSVNIVGHCMSARRVGFSTHESQSTWAFLPLLAKNESILLRLASCHIIVTLDTLSRLMTSLSCLLLLSTLNFLSEKVCLSTNSIHRLMPTWAFLHSILRPFVSRPFHYISVCCFLLPFPLPFLQLHLVYISCNIPLYIITF